ncbi:MAG: response regulator [Rhodobacteraceae bacterium]|nr:MAG: response regulator [Paracoccaceae bacterium]
MEQTGLIHRFGAGLLTALALVCALITGILAAQLAGELRALAGNSTDNVQWSLSQSEVEFLEFQAALARARHSDPPDLEAVRLEFDIFYSRVGTLEAGPIYSDMRAQPEFDAALTEIRTFLDAAAPRMDAADPALIAALPDLSDSAATLRHALRRLTVSGLMQFAAVMDDRRMAIRRTLTRLAVVALALVGVLGFLAWYSHRVGRQALHHGRALAEARDRALAGEKAKADFLAVMSHEIRTPLNGILGNVALLEDSDLDADQARFVRNMGVSGRVLLDHVESVLDLARFTPGRIALTQESLEVDRLLQDIVDSQDSHALAQGNRLSWAWVGTPERRICADRAALQQILLNLVSNALKFTRHGEVRVEVEVDARTEARGEIEFRVIDTGAGIAAADLPHVFDDFRTTDASFGRIAGGTGLGLGIARRLVQAMAGEIGGESTLGQGSVFWVRLPILRPAEESPAETAAPERLRILVVEDNAINLDVARDMISRLGHSVTPARTGREGVAAATAEAFDLILMDIAMPEMDGLAAACAIRSSGGASAKTPIVALTANVRPEDRDRFRAAGLSTILTKPLQKDRLIRLLARLGAVPTATEDTPPDDIPPGLRARFDRETEELLAWLASLPEDRADIARRCHRLAGTAAVFGQADLRRALIALEEAARAGVPFAQFGVLAERLADLRADRAAPGEGGRARLPEARLRSVP